MRLEQDSCIPLYYQIKEAIKADIEQGTLKPGDQLPTETELADQLGISRSTVRQALLSLAREGRVYRRRGKGTFVSEPKIQADVGNFFIPAEFGDVHKFISSRVLVPPPSLVEDLRLSGGEMAVVLERLRMANGEPIVVEKSYIPLRICPGLDSKTFDGKLYDFLAEEYDLLLVEAETYVEPTILDQCEAGLLGVKQGTAAMLLTRINYMSDGTPAVITKSVVRGDRCRIRMHTGGSSRG